MRTETGQVFVCDEPGAMYAYMVTKVEEHHTWLSVKAVKPGASGVYYDWSELGRFEGRELAFFLKGYRLAHDMSEQCL